MHSRISHVDEREKAAKEEGVGKSSDGQSFVFGPGICDDGGETGGGWCLEQRSAFRCCCLVWTGANLNAFCSSIHALLSTGVEALAVFQALRWANVKGLRKIQILTDSFEVVKALCCIRNANDAIRNVVLDILDIVSYFDYVNVIMATRQRVVKIKV